MDTNRCMGCTVGLLKWVRVVGNEAREVVSGQIMKGPWKWGYSMLEGQITLEADIRGGLKQWFLMSLEP